jgi:hypothetical protein
MLKLLLPLFLSLSLFAETVGGIAILVEDEPITLHEVSATMRENRIGLDECVRVLVRQKLEAIEAEKRNISVSTLEVSDEVKNMARQNNMTVMEFYDAVHRSQGTSEAALKERIRTGLINKKLYSAIAFSQMVQPTDEEIEEYYRSHKEEFGAPESFKVLVYRGSSKEKLEAKVNNPMLYVPEISSEERVLRYDGMEPRLAQLLTSTQSNSFTPVLPDADGFVCFFVQEKNGSQATTLESVRGRIENVLMGEKRQQVLNDYFSRLQLTADIRVIRLPE